MFPIYKICSTWLLLPPSTCLEESLPVFFIIFQVFLDCANKIRTWSENIFGRIVKNEFCVCRETLWVSEKREHDDSESVKSGQECLHTEGMVFSS